MRIRETKEVERNISFERACVYYMCDHSINAKWQDLANTVVEHDGYIHDTVCTNDNGISNAKFREGTKRDMTPIEVIAWHHIQAHNACRDGYNGTCPEICPFYGVKNCPYGHSAEYNRCAIIMEGKEVIE